MPYIKDNELLRVFEQRMQTLKEDGVFSSQKRAIVGNARYLIVSYGGTGADALFKIRRTLQKTLPAEDYERYVRFLAIDTDQKTMELREQIVVDGQKKLVLKDALKPEEFCWLDGSAARSVLNPPNPEIKEWINPNLLGLIDSSKNYLDGNGASATRQVGRLTLFPEKVCGKLRKMISGQVKPLIEKNKDPLYVFVVSGISGGTGSGIVVDATYLIRDTIAGIVNGLAGRTKISGFILLPTTGDPDASEDNKSKGNRNGYAALKEINHFMTLASRKDRYIQKYANMTVDTAKPIFDTCFLMDGMQMDIYHENPREFVKDVLADCIVDMITSHPTVDDGTAPPRAVESLTSDVTPFTIAMLGGKKKEDAPRDVDYQYCVLGHGNVSIPVDEIKTYVAKQIFDKMYALYQNNGNVDDKDVKDFVKAVNKSRDWKKTAQNELKQYFVDREYGPFFVINLLHDAGPELDRMGRQLFADKERLEEIKTYLNKLNNTYFAVFTEVLESLKQILVEQHDMVCRGTYFKDVRGVTSYSFTPIDLTTGNAASNAVRSYLSDLVKKKYVDKLSDELLQTIIENKDKWAGLDKKATPNGPSFDAPAQIRVFWEKEIDKIVSATIEDLLIKLYANDRDARYDSNDPKSQEYLETAANEIFNSMFGGAGKALPSASLRVGNGLSMSNFNGHNYMMVPEAAPHLLAALRDVAKIAEIPVHVYGSTANDSIACYSQYTSIPAFKFVWTKDGEQAYERDIGSTGLHMAETSGTNEWRDLPNLMPRSTWHLLENYSNPREEILADRAEYLFNKAKELSLTMAVPAIGVDLLQYSMKRLKDELLPDPNLFREFDIRNVSAADQKTIEDRERIWKEIEDFAQSSAEKLYNSVEDWSDVDNIVVKLEKTDASTFIWKELRAVDAVLSVPNMPDGWSEHIAACFLRKMPDLMLYMRGTLMVIERLKAMVDATQAEARQIVDFTKYVVADLFFYDKEYYQWKYSDGRREYELLDVEEAIQKRALYYFLFEAYKANSENVKLCLEPEYEEASGKHATDRKERIMMRKALNKKAKDIYDANMKQLTIDHRDPDKLSQLGSKEFEKLAKSKGYDHEAIMAMYEKMNETIEAVFDIHEEF